MNKYYILRKFLDAKTNRDKYNEEYAKARQDVLRGLGETKQAGVEGDIKFNVYPAFANKINVGNFAKDHPQKFKRMKAIEAEIKTLRDELKVIEAVMKNGYAYPDINSGPIRWTVKVSKR